MRSSGILKDLIDSSKEPRLAMASQSESNRDSIFSQLRQQAQNLEKTTTVLKDALNSKRSDDAEGSADGMNIILHCTKDMKELHKKVVDTKRNFVDNCRNTSRIAELIERVLGVQSERLEKVETFIEKYGYVRPKLKADEEQGVDADGSDVEQIEEESGCTTPQHREVTIDASRTPKMEDFCPNFQIVKQRIDNRETANCASETMTDVHITYMTSSSAHSRTPEMPESLRKVCSSLKKQTNESGPMDWQKNQKLMDDMASTRTPEMPENIRKLCSSMKKPGDFQTEVQIQMPTNINHTQSAQGNGSSTPEPPSFLKDLMNKKSQKATLPLYEKCTSEKSSDKTPEMPVEVRGMRSFMNKNMDFNPNVNMESTTQTCYQPAVTADIYSTDMPSTRSRTPEMPENIRKLCSSIKNPTDFQTEVHRQMPSDNNHTQLAKGNGSSTPQPPSFLKDFINKKKQNATMSQDNQADITCVTQSISSFQMDHNAQPPESVTQETKLLDIEDNLNNTEPIAPSASTLQHIPKMQPAPFESVPERFSKQMSDMKHSSTPQTPDIIKKYRQKRIQESTVRLDTTKGEISQSSISSVQPLQQNNYAATYQAGQAKQPVYTAGDVDILTDDPAARNYQSKMVTDWQPKSVKSLFGGNDTKGASSEEISTSEYCARGKENRAFMQGKPRSSRSMLPQPSKKY